MYTFPWVTQLCHLDNHCLEKDPECLSYSNLTSERRSSSFRLPTDDTASCDNKLPPGWYRFLPPAGVQMATSPPPQGMCATPVTSWLSSEHPQETDGIVNGTVCFRWGDNMCMWSQVIQVRNCSGFYVYKLQPTKYCPLHFCGQDWARYWIFLLGRFVFIIYISIYHTS